jgi:uncharacterized protein (DUF2164 family)
VGEGPRCCAETISLVHEQAEDDLYENSGFLQNFDLGVLFHYQGSFDSSRVYLAKAEEIAEQLFTVSITNELSTFLLNDNTRPYRPRPEEAVFLQELQILNYLARGDFEGAAVQARISEDWTGKILTGKGLKFNATGLAYVRALAYEAHGDADDARIAYENAGQGQAAGSSEVIVVGYTGLSPILGEQKFTGSFIYGAPFITLYSRDAKGKAVSQVLPFPAIPPSVMGEATGGGKNFGGTVSLSLALPEFRERPFATAGFFASVDGTSQSSTTIDFVGQNLGSDFQNEKDGVFARNIARVTLRTITAQIAKAKTQVQNEGLNLLKNLAIDGFQSAVESADIRVSAYLPSKVQVARFPVGAGSHPASATATTRSGTLVQKRDYGSVAVRSPNSQNIFLFLPVFQYTLNPNPRFP